MQLVMLVECRSVVLVQTVLRAKIHILLGHKHRLAVDPRVHTGAAVLAHMAAALAVARPADHLARMPGGAPDALFTPPTVSHPFYFVDNGHVVVV